MVIINYLAWWLHSLSRVCVIFETLHHKVTATRVPPRGQILHTMERRGRQRANSCVALFSLGSTLMSKILWVCVCVRCLCVSVLEIYGRTLHIISVWLFCLFSKDTLYYIHIHLLTHCWAMLQNDLCLCRSQETELLNLELILFRCPKWNWTSLWLLKDCDDGWWKY